MFDRRQCNKHTMAGTLWEHKGWIINLSLLPTLNNQVSIRNSPNITFRSFSIVNIRGGYWWSKDMGSEKRESFIEDHPCTSHSQHVGLLRPQLRSNFRCWQSWSTNQSMHNNLGLTLRVGDKIWWNGSKFDPLPRWFFGTENRPHQRAPIPPLQTHFGRWSDWLHYFCLRSLNGQRLHKAEILSPLEL